MLQLYLSGKFIQAGHVNKIKVLFVFRLLLCIVCFVCCLAVCLFFAVEDFSYMHTPTEEQETVYYMWTASEYLMVSAFFLYLLTLTKEFSMINVTIFVELINGQRLIGDEQQANEKQNPRIRPE